METQRWFPSYFFESKALKDWILNGENKK